MSSVYEKFSHLWSERTATAVAPHEDQSVSEAEQRSASVKDMRVFIGTVAYKDYRDWLDREIEQMSPDPAMGTDVASCYTFKREGLIASRRRLDAMVRLAEEKLSNG